MPLNSSECCLKGSCSTWKLPTALLFAMQLVATGALAQPAHISQSQEYKELYGKAGEWRDKCPNPTKLRGLCMMVGSRIQTEDSDRSSFRYLYQVRIREAACVSPTDSKQEEAEKISRMWRRYEKVLVCSNSQFDVTNGSVLKFAVTTYFERFIDEVIAWRIDLNYVDASDQRTLLDYTLSQSRRNQGTSLEQKFDYYAEKLRGAGAKLSSELR